MSVKNLKVIALGLSALMISSCGHDGDNKEKKETATVNSTKMLKVTKTQPDITLRLPAELIAFNETDIYARVNGYVKNVLVDRGSKVAKGQLLAEIEAPELEAQLADAFAKKIAVASNYKASRLNYQRLLQTSATIGAVSANDLDQNKEKMLSDSALSVAAEANYKSVKEMKNYLRVESPFAGIITERNVSPGALVGTTGKSAMFELKQEDRLRLTVAIPEAYTGQVFEEKQVKFKVKAFPDKVFNAVLARRAEGLTTNIRAEMVEFDVNNTQGDLKSGMYAEVVLEFSRQQPSVYVPKTAVVNATDKIYVIKSVNGLAKKIPVRCGNNTGNMVEIFGDINEDDLIVLNASDEIKEGSALNPEMK